MQALVWWLVPVAGFLLALAWVTVRNRPRPPVDPHESMAEHQRFREALQTPVADPDARSPKRSVRRGRGGSRNADDPDVDGGRPGGS
jgi:hypothetical protein